MSHDHQPDKFVDFVDEIRARQRNVVFPDTVRNARSADAFFETALQIQPLFSELPRGCLARPSSAWVWPSHSWQQRLATIVTGLAIGLCCSYPSLYFAGNTDISQWVSATPETERLRNRRALDRQFQLLKRR
jgi:hypothetical protein